MRLPTVPTDRGRAQGVRMRRILLLGLAVVAMLPLFSGSSEAYRIGSGVVWQQQDSGTTVDLAAVDFVDADIGWSVGQQGTILRTGDGGRTWSSQRSGTSVDLFDVHFVDATTGWASGVGGTVLRTTDGGVTWADRSPDDEPDGYWGPDRALYGIAAVDADTAWTVGHRGQLFSTTDGGVTWFQQGLGRFDMSDFFLHGVHFVNRDTGWIVGKLGFILGTSDGGKTWDTQLEHDNGPPLLRLAFADAQNGWAVGGFDGRYSMERIFHTTNGGRTWTLQYEEAGTRFSDIACLDRETAWVVDWFDDVLYTTDGGETWEKQPLAGDFGGVDFVDQTTGWAVGQGGRIVKAVPATMVAPTFADTADSPYMTAIELIADAGIASGYGDGTFGPQDPLFRAQFAKLICLALRLPVDESMDPPFTDLGEDWLGSFYPTEFVAAAAQHGIVNGVRPGIFHPWVDVSRAQVVTMVVRALETVEPGRLVQPPASFTGSIGRFDPVHAENVRVAEYNHLLDDLVGFGPGWNPWAKMTRGEIAQVIWNGRSAP